MTTIATRGDGIVAADTQCTWGETVKTRVPKLHRLKDGRVVAGCGLLSEVLAVVQWLETGKGEPPKLKNCDVMVAADGATYTLSRGGILSPVTGPLAIGSGMQAAMAAMVHYDATAVEAVQAAASVDPNTSAPIEVMSVEPKRVKRSKR